MNTKTFVANKTWFSLHGAWAFNWSTNVPNKYIVIWNTTRPNVRSARPVWHHTGSGLSLVAWAIPPSSVWGFGHTAKSGNALVVARYNKIVNHVNPSKWFPTMASGTKWANRWMVMGGGN